MKKKILAFILLCVMVVSAFSACVFLNGEQTVEHLETKLKNVDEQINFEENGDKYVAKTEGIRSVTYTAKVGDDDVIDEIVIVFENISSLGRNKMQTALERTADQMTMEDIRIANLALITASVFEFCGSQDRETEDEILDCCNIYYYEDKAVDFSNWTITGVFDSSAKTATLTAVYKGE